MIPHVYDTQEDKKRSSFALDNDDDDDDDVSRAGMCKTIEGQESRWRQKKHDAHSRREARASCKLDAIRKRDVTM